MRVWPCCSRICWPFLMGEPAVQGASCNARVIGAAAPASGHVRAALLGAQLLAAAQSRAVHCSVLCCCDARCWGRCDAANTCCCAHHGSVHNPVAAGFARLWKARHRLLLAAPAVRHLVRVQPCAAEAVCELDGAAACHLRAAAAALPTESEGSWRAPAPMLPLACHSPTRYLMRPLPAAAPAPESAAAR